MFKGNNFTTTLATSMTATPTMCHLLNPLATTPTQVRVESPSHPCPASLNPLSLNITCDTGRVNIIRPTPGVYYLYEFDLEDVLKDQCISQTASAVKSSEVCHGGLYYRLSPATPYLLLSYVHANPTPRNAVRNIIVFNPKGQPVVYSYHNDNGGKATLLPLDVQNLGKRKYKILLCLQNGIKK